MPRDAELTRLEARIQELRQGYLREVQRGGRWFNDQSRSRLNQSITLLGIIDDAQNEIEAGFRPPDTVAQIDEIIDNCRATTKIGRSRLGTLAAQVKARVAGRYDLRPRPNTRAVQSPEWNAAQSVIDVLITDPNTRRLATKIDAQIAVQCFDDVIGGDDDIAGITLRDDTGIASCHPTALGLQGVLGQHHGYQATAGGAGPERRALAVALALEALREAAPARVIWLRCTATCDGHSFTLVKKPSGRVDVLEAWANPRGNGYLLPLKRQLIHNLQRHEAVEAVTRLNDQNSRVRDQGYGALSTAYGNASQQPSHHFEERNQQHEHDSDENISIVATVRDLAAYGEVKHRMTERYLALAAIRRRLGVGG
jgi:hypothetical protein